MSLKVTVKNNQNHFHTISPSARDHHGTWYIHIYWFLHCTQSYYYILNYLLSGLVPSITAASHCLLGGSLEMRLSTIYINWYPIIFLIYSTIKYLIDEIATNSWDYGYTGFNSGQNSYLKINEVCLTRECTNLEPLATWIMNKIFETSQWPHICHLDLQLSNLVWKSKVGTLLTNYIYSYKFLVANYTY